MLSASYIMLLNYIMHVQSEKRPKAAKNIVFIA